MIKGCIVCKGKCDPRAERCRSCDNLHKTGENHPLFKERLNDNGQGYARVHTPKEHPYVKSRHMLEHRYIMEQYLGRYLKPYETVHHKNGIRNDNRIDNLELWVKKQPAGQRIEDLIKWAKDILEEYDGH